MRDAILFFLSIAALALISLVLILTLVLVDEDPVFWMGKRLAVLTGGLVLAVLATSLMGRMRAAAQAHDGTPHNHCGSCRDRLFHAALALMVSRAAQTLLILLILALWFSLYFASAGVTTYNPGVYGIVSYREVGHRHHRVT
jgi:hypothetical protein